MVKLELGHDDPVEMATLMIQSWDELPVDADGSIYLVSAEQYKFLEDVYACVNQRGIQGENAQGSSRSKEEARRRVHELRDRCY